VEYLKGSTLLKGKLNIPRSQPPLVPRPHLGEQLNQGVKGKLVLVYAPAGYGKTTALGEWVRQGNMPAGWVSLDKGDNDPFQFWRYVIAALEGVIPGTAREIMPLLKSLDSLPLENFITLLMKKLYSFPGDFILVLDDFHHIENNLIQEGLFFFVKHMPENMLLVMAGRQKPSLNLTRLKVRGEVKEITLEDLSFNREELLTFCRQRGIEIDEKDLEKLHQRLEGWAAGLCMGFISLGQEKGPSRLLENIRGTSPHIASYLAEEVFNSWEGEVQDFLLETSLLDTLSGDLCDELTGGTGSGEILERLSRDNAFILTLDGQEGLYRYHRIFSEFLRDLLAKKKGSKVSLLHLQAGRWFERKGFFREGISHYLRGMDHQGAARLLEKVAPEMLKNMETNGLLSWLGELPPELVAKRGVLCLAYAWALTLEGKTEEAHGWVKKAEKGIGEEENKEGELSSLLRGEQMFLGFYLAHKGKDFPRAQELCLEAMGHFSRKGRLFENPYIFNEGEASLLGGVMGYYHRLKKLTRLPFEDKVRGAMEKIGAPPGYLEVVAGELLYEWNEINRAITVLMEGISEAGEKEALGVLIPGLIALARIHRARGNLEEALGIMEEAFQKVKEGGHLSWLPLLEAFKVQLLLSRGEGGEIKEWEKKYSLNIYDPLAPSRELEYITLARVLGARGSLEDSRVLLDRLHLMAEREQRLQSLVEILNLQALAYFQEGENHKAMELLEKSLLLGESLGYFRKFVDEGKAMMILLVRFQKGQGKKKDHKKRVSPGYIQNLIRLTREGVKIMGPGEHYREARPEVLLTRRELQVIGLLARGMSNQEISQKLSIALPTVKAHVSNVMGKLGVKSRGQAVERARELNLI